MLNYSPIILRIILEYWVASKFPKLFQHNSLRPNFQSITTSSCSETLYSLLGISPAILHSPYCLQHSAQPLLLHRFQDIRFGIRSHFKWSRVVVQSPCSTWRVKTEDTVECNGILALHVATAGGSSVSKPVTAV